MRDAVRLAVGTLTRWPVPPPTVVDPLVARGAMLLAPWIGALIGTAAAVTAWVAGMAGFGALLTAALVVALLAYTTRGLHLDGLADTADGLGSGRDVAGALALMRRGPVGPMGVATLVLVLLVQVAALEQVLVAWGPIALPAVLTASRLTLPLACASNVGAARPEGLGVAMAGSVPRLAALADLLLVAVVMGAALVLAGGSSTGVVVPLVVVDVAVVAVAGVTWGVVRTARRRFGGITGDVLGASVELCLAAALIAVAALASLA